MDNTKTTTTDSGDAVATDYPLATCTGKPSLWVLNPENWDALPDDEREYLAENGCAPLRTFYFEDHDIEVQVGQWFGSLIFDVRQWAEVTGLYWLAHREDESAGVDADGMFARFFHCGSMGEIARWALAEVMPHFFKRASEADTVKWNTLAKRSE